MSTLVPTSSHASPSAGNADYDDRMKLSLLKCVPMLGRVYGLTFVPGANRLLVSLGGDGTILLDATTGKQVAKLPKDSSVSAMDPNGALATVTSDGKTVGNRHEWDVSLWDLAKGKKIGPLAKNHPDDRLSPDAIGKTRLLATRKKKNTYSFCLYDRAGKRVAEHGLGKVELPFHAAMSSDERIAAHAYFTGAAHVVDLGTGKSQKLEGGTLRIGRQHHKGITSLAIDPTGEHVMYASSGSGKVHVWSTRTRRSVSGKWTSAPVSDAIFHAGGLAVMHSSSQTSTITWFPLAGKGAPREISVGKGATLFADAGDDRHVACVGHSGAHAFAEEGVGVWDVVTGKRVAKAAQPKGMDEISAVGAHRDRLALGDRKRGVAIFAVA